MRKFFLFLALAICAIKGDEMREIYLAGGCFWGVQAYFDRVSGVKFSEVGYANGNSEKTSYYELKTSDHAETLHLKFDEHIVSLAEILTRFFSVIDPFSIDKQGNDVGRQYRSGIFYLDEKLGDEIRNFVAQKEKSLGKKIAVVVEPLKNFVKAEDYHQKYLEKNPSGYCHIDISKANAPAMDESEFKLLSNEAKRANLSQIAYAVTQEKATERPFSSEFDKFNAKGIYIDIVTKKPLFSSSDKFDAGCGWPSFSKPITTDALKYELDDSHNMKRTEVSSRLGGAHLGHVFDDGPKDKGGLRYCINGVSLEFIPFDEMEARGYGEYKIYVK